MTTNLQKNSRSSPAILLSVQYPKRPGETFYIEPGLTIGRGLSNTVAIPDNPNIARGHAQVIQGADGEMVLCAISSNGLTTADREVSRLQLQAGTSFSIGDVFFECRSATLHAAEGLPVESSVAYPDPSTDEMIAPQLIGGYAVTERVLQSPSLDVFDALVPGGKRKVRIEFLSQRAVATLRRPDAFLKGIERRFSARHASLAGLLDWGTQNDRPYLVWESPKGTSLAEIMADYKELGSQPQSDDLRPWLKGIGEALQALVNRRLSFSGSSLANVWIKRGQGIVLRDCLMFSPGIGVHAIAGFDDHWQLLEEVECDAPELITEQLTQLARSLRVGSKLVERG